MIYERVLAALASNNCKLTPQRREILKVIVRAKTHLSARQIFDRLRKKYPQMSFDTVYRNLAILRELHIINLVDFRNGCSRYELNRQQDHNHQIICLKCGGAWKLPECPVKNLTSVNNLDDFKVTGHRFEIFGYCRECQKVGQV